MAIFCSEKEFSELYQDLADKAQLLRLQAKGGSMHPFIQSGDLVDITLYRDGDCDARKGDVVLFKKEDVLYLHRIIKNKNGALIVKGDQSLGIDGEISKEDILGKAVSVQRAGRKIDLYSRPNRFISVFMADSGFILQYVFLFFRKITSLIFVVISRIQGLSIYRRMAQKLFKPEVAVRQVQPEDEEQLRDLYLMAGHDIREGIAKIRSEGFWLVGEKKGRVLGGLTVSRYELDPNLWVIFGLEVKPLFRGLGIGEQILRGAMVKAKESGAKVIGLFVNKKARPAIGLYSKLGFKITDDFPPEYNRAADELYLSYKINA